jgi:zinc transporter, ZIP family
LARGIRSQTGRFSATTLSGIIAPPRSKLLFLGLALTSDAPGGWRIVALSAGLGATVFAAALGGNMLLAGASHTLIGGVLAFSAAALLYLVTEELLIEAHQGPEPETPVSTLVLFAGFLVFWSIQLAG